MSNGLWFELLEAKGSWTSLWFGYVICSNCQGIRQIETNCPACGDPPYDLSPRVMTLPDGTTHQVPAAFPGAEGRFEDYAYLSWMEREWNRVIPDEELQMVQAGFAPYPKVTIILLWWTYFETRIERLLRSGMRTTPTAIVEDALERYSSIGARLDRLYKVVFGASYAADLQNLGKRDIWDLIREVQDARNRFMHGDPKAITESLTLKVVGRMRDEHEAWIQIYNSRGTLTAPRQTP